MSASLDTSMPLSRPMYSPTPSPSLQSLSPVDHQWRVQQFASPAGSPPSASLSPRHRMLPASSASPERSPDVNDRPSPSRRDDTEPRYHVAGDHPQSSNGAAHHQRETIPRRSSEGHDATPNAEVFTPFGWETHAANMPDLLRASNEFNSRGGGAGRGRSGERSPNTPRREHSSRRAGSEPSRGRERGPRRHSEGSTQRSASWSPMRVLPPPYLLSSSASAGQPSPLRQSSLSPLQPQILPEVPQDVVARISQRASSTRSASGGSPREWKRGQWNSVSPPRDATPPVPPQQMNVAQHTQVSDAVQLESRPGRSPFPETMARTGGPPPSPPRLPSLSRLEEAARSASRSPTAPDTVESSAVPNAATQIASGMSRHNNGVVVAAPTHAVVPPRSLQLLPLETVATNPLLGEREQPSGTDRNGVLDSAGSDGVHPIGHTSVRRRSSDDIAAVDARRRELERAHEQLRRATEVLRNPGGHNIPALYFQPAPEQKEASAQATETSSLNEPADAPAVSDARAETASKNSDIVDLPRALERERALLDAEAARVSPREEKRDAAPVGSLNLLGASSPGGIGVQDGTVLQQVAVDDEAVIFATDIARTLATPEDRAQRPPLMAPSFSGSRSTTPRSPARSPLRPHAHVMQKTNPLADPLAGTDTSPLVEERILEQRLEPDEREARLHQGPAAAEMGTPLSPLAIAAGTMEALSPMRTPPLPFPDTAREGAAAAAQIPTSAQPALTLPVETAGNSNALPTEQPARQETLPPVAHRGAETGETQRRDEMTAPSPASTAHSHRIDAAARRGVPFSTPLLQPHSTSMGDVGPVSSRHDSAKPVRRIMTPLASALPPEPSPRDEHRSISAPSAARTESASHLNASGSTHAPNESAAHGLFHTHIAAVHAGTERDRSASRSGGDRSILTPPRPAPSDVERDEESRSPVRRFIDQHLDKVHRYYSSRITALEHVVAEERAHNNPLAIEAKHAPLPQMIEDHSHRSSRLDTDQRTSDPAHGMLIDAPSSQHQRRPETALPSPSIAASSGIRYAASRAPSSSAPARTDHHNNGGTARALQFQQSSHGMKQHSPRATSPDARGTPFSQPHDGPRGSPPRHGAARNDRLDEPSPESELSFMDSVRKQLRDRKGGSVPRDFRAGSERRDGSPNRLKDLLGSRYYDEVRDRGTANAPYAAHALHSNGAMGNPTIEPTAPTPGGQWRSRTAAEKERETIARPVRERVAAPTVSFSNMEAHLVRSRSPSAPEYQYATAAPSPHSPSPHAPHQPSLGLWPAPR